MYHNPVLMNIAVNGLITSRSGIYVDATFGGGGYSSEILKQLNDEGKLFAFDHDSDALENRLLDNRFVLFHQNFRFIEEQLTAFNVYDVDGIVADLGVSSHQFDIDNRGFSIRSDVKLDMRMNKNSKLSAYNVINNYSDTELIKIFKTYGELPRSHKIAARIIERRKDSPIVSSDSLIECIRSLAPFQKKYKFYARVFQAIRIEVNKELDALECLLNSSLKVLKIGGRLVVVSYHSLEDRMVKKFMKSGDVTGEISQDIFGNKSNPFFVLTKKPIIPSQKEIQTNNRARSAKLRIAERQ